MFRILPKLYLCVTIILITSIVSFAGGQNGAASRTAGNLRVKSGVKLLLDLDTPLNSATARVDDIVWFTARNDVRIDGRLAMLRGTPIRGSVVSVKPALVNGKNQRTEIQVRLEEIPLAEGGSLAIATEALTVKGEKIGASTAGAVQNGVGQAMQGAVLGGSIGRSARGAAIGAVVAAGIGIVTAALQKGGPSSDVDLPSGSVFEAKLERALVIPDPAMLAKSIPRPPATVTPDLTAPSTGELFAGVSVASARTPESNDAPARSVPAFESLAGAAPPVPVDASASTNPLGPRDAEPNTEAMPATSGSATLKVDVNLVPVDAIVRDRTGKPMSNLRLEDFRVLEDGVEQRIQFFSRDKQPLAVALVIDRSGSVAPLMSQVQTAAYQALQLLKSGDQVCLFAFAGSVELLEELTTNRQRVANRIGAIKAGGGTNIVDAVAEALRYLHATAPDKRRAVILVSDNMEGHSAVSVDYAIESALETEAVIYSVKVGKAAGGTLFGLPGIPGLPIPSIPLPGVGGGDPVPALTKETGGEIFDATGGASIAAALTTAVDRLKLRYTLSYASENSATPRSAKGGYHRIQVQLVSRFGRPDIDYTVHARSGYYDPAPKPNVAAAQR